MDQNTASLFDAELIQRYTRSGPRYTSYPPAPFFSDDFGSEDYRAEVRNANEIETSRPLSIYVHLPFCKSVCRFCACNVHFTKDRHRGVRYVEHVLGEMDALSGLLAQGREVHQVHWGGGTPTFLEAGVLEHLAARTREIFQFADDAELSVEIDPREADEDRLEVLASAGFRRFSMGVQDFDPRVQEAVHRHQPFDLTRQVIEYCRGLGASSINVDLMYGLPYQSTATFRNTLEKVISLKPDRIALFNFAYLPESVRHQRAIDPASLPEPDERLAILRLAVETLTATGMVFIGMDHFARPEDELAQALEDGTLYRNFQGYTTRSSCDLHAFGASAISQFGSVYAQNARDVDDYEEAMSRDRLATVRGLRLSADDLLRRDVISRLLCRFEIDKEQVEKEYGIEFDEVFRESLVDLAPMESDGLVRLEPQRVRVLPKGRFLVRNIAMAFDAYRLHREQGRYSSTV